jgi:chemotaxis protein CheD
MLKKFEALNIPRNEIEVKIFGGADVLKTSSHRKTVSTVGSQNIKMAIETLAEFNMSANVMDVGGTVGRKIIFATCTGEIFLNRLKENGKNKSFNS